MSLSADQISDLTADHPSPSTQAKGRRIKPVPAVTVSRRKSYARLIEDYVRGRVAVVAAEGKALDPQTRALAEMIGGEHGLMRVIGSGGEPNQLAKPGGVRSAHATGKNTKHRGRGVRADMERADEATEVAAARLAGLLTSTRRKRKAAAAMPEAQDTANQQVEVQGSGTVELSLAEQ